MEEENHNADRDPQQSKEQICPFCQTNILVDDVSKSCDDCSTLYHHDCWEENEGCAIYGCKSSAETIKWSDHQVPLSYWGKETKSCPNCEKEIVASALRCKHCGTVFKSSRPANSEDFASDRHYEEIKNSLKRKTTWVFIANAIPLLGLFGLLLGGLWTLKNRKFINKLPGIHRTLCYLGLLVGVAQIALFTSFGYLYFLTNTGH